MQQSHCLNSLTLKVFFLLSCYLCIEERIVQSKFGSFKPKNTLKCYAFASEIDINICFIDFQSSHLNILYSYCMTNMEFFHHNLIHTYFVYDTVNT